ncbi:MAG TPA: ABC transporter permease [Candidatus Binatia bacterium]|nr:ABC transporter permease [Candidatus Binatia bacterium]
MDGRVRGGLLQAVAPPLRSAVRRLGLVVPTLGALLVLAFALVHLAPGDPIVALAGEHGDPGHYAAMRAKFGLDRPLPERFAVYVGRVLRADLGTSFVHGRPVAAVIAERLPATLLLMLTALAVSTALGVALGTLAARRVARPEDFALRAASLLGSATPVFWLGQLALILLAVGTGLFPVQGMSDARRPAVGVAHLLDVLHHLALPALVLAAGELALTARLVRTGLLQALGADYVRTARAKGLPEGRVVAHALRNALLPVLTVIGARVGALCSGAVLVEAVFAWPGVGRLMLSALLARDHPVVLGIFLLVSLGVLLANLLTDLAYGWLDPRIGRD